jgi:hypothetical protein
MKPPVIKKAKYNQSLDGVFGEFGSGASTQVSYLQTAIVPQDLAKTTLISDIPGSEAWQVPDLFQREVDVRRVTKGLLPYLQDSKKVKFFNPLTLTVLPFDKDGAVLGALPSVTKRTEQRDGTDWTVIEVPGYYQLSHVDGAIWGKLEWNDENVRLVAIDGQHRLSALKRCLNDPTQANTLAGWSIPAVILTLRESQNSKADRQILEVVRSIFMYINKEAKAPNRARSILLSEDSINAIATQELLQLSHSNDVSENKNLNRLPLLCFDWRGQEDDGKRVPSPASLKSIDEIEDWFIHYIAGEDFSAEQEKALGIQPTDKALKKAYVEKRLDSEASRAARERIRTQLVEAVAALLQSFAPYADYVKNLRSLEAKYLKESDLARHAFYQLRFGSNNAGDGEKNDVASLLASLVGEIDSLKSKTIPSLLQLDIGMRGIVCAFGLLREHYNNWKGKSVPWDDYSKWFSGVLNTAYHARHFDTKNKDVAKLLRHITHDHGGSIVNYRLEDSEGALGAYVALFACAHGAKAGTMKADAWESFRELMIERLEPTVLRGYKKEVRPALRELYPNGGVELTNEVKKKAGALTKSHMALITSTANKVAK